MDIVSRVEQDINILWRLDFVHEWYASNKPGPALIEENSRSIQMACIRFFSGYLRIQVYVLGIKDFPTCPECNITLAASKHILICIGCKKNQLFSSSQEILTNLKLHGFKDLDAPV